MISIEFRALKRQRSIQCYPLCSHFPGGSDGKASAYNVGDPGLIPGLGRSSGEGNGNPLQYSCLENPMDGGSWKTTVHGVAKSRTRLSYFTFFHFLSFLCSYRLDKQDIKMHMNYALKLCIKIKLPVCTKCVKEKAL